MARKPSFEFERRERTKEKAAKKAEKTKAKADKRIDQASDAPPSDDAAKIKT